LALSAVYDVEVVARALRDALAFDAYRSEYLANLLQSRAHQQSHTGLLMSIFKPLGCVQFYAGSSKSRLTLAV
jgi:hypothetical protein